jgi:hypothetical protein
MPQSDHSHRSSMRRREHGTEQSSTVNSHPQNSPAFGDSDYDRAANDRPPTYMPSFKAQLVAQHPYRMKALEGHMRWLEKQLKRRGLNPEDARWVL